MRKLKAIQREQRANYVLTCYADYNGNFRDPMDLRDLLADMMHYCKANNIDFNHELSMATDHYSEEK